MDLSALPTRIVHWLIAWRLPLLVVALILAALSIRPASRLDFDLSMENMFAADDPRLVAHRKSKKIFGGHEVALAAFADDGLLTSRGLARLDAITKQLKSVPGVETAVSLTSTPLGTEIATNPLGEPFLRLFEGYTIGPDRKTAGVVCVLKPERTGGVVSGPRARTIAALREITIGEGGVLVGEPVMVLEGFRQLEEDGGRLGWAATGLLVLTIVLCFRSLRWVVVPIVIVNITLLWTKAVVSLAGARLSLVSSMLWANITVIGVGLVVHVVVGFREARTSGLSPPDALRVAGGALAMPIFWTCATDAAGFGALLKARLGPIQDFGLMMLIGSVMALISVAVVLPGLALLGRFDADPQRAWGEGRLDLALRGLAVGLQRRPAIVGVVSIVLAIAVSLGCFRLEIETDFTRNFRSNSEIARSYAFVEERLGGAGVWDIVVPAPAELDREFFDRLRRMETRLRDDVQIPSPAGPTAGLTKVLSLADVLDAVDLGPITEFAPIELQVEQLERLMPSLASSLHGEDPDVPGRRYVRVMLRARERQPAAARKSLIAQVGRIANEEFPGAETTGLFVLLTALIESVGRDQWLTFAVATAAIGAMMWIAFKSPTLALVALVPNLLPIFVVTGLLGWLGIKVNTGAAMIAAVSMGLSVDSSVHYLTLYRRIRSQGVPVRNALEETHHEVGRAMVFSTLALMVGFSALSLSHFVPTIYFGVLVSLTMLGGLAGNLVLLPVLIQWVDREKPSQLPPPAPSDTIDRPLGG